MPITVFRTPFPSSGSVTRVPIGSASPPNIFPASPLTSITLVSGSPVFPPPHNRPPLGLGAAPLPQAVFETGAAGGVGGRGAGGAAGERRRGGGKHPPARGEKNLGGAGVLGGESGGGGAGAGARRQQPRQSAGGREHE